MPAHGKGLKVFIPAGFGFGSAALWLSAKESITGVLAVIRPDGMKPQTQ